MSESEKDVTGSSLPESIWLVNAEIAMDGKVGFMNLTVWAFSGDDAIQRIKAYLSKYDWGLLSTERVVEPDASQDYGEAVNGLIAHTMQNPNFIGLGTYFTYPPN